MAIGNAGLAAGIAKEASTTKPFKTFLSRYFYLGMSLVFAAIVIVGFSQTVNANLLHANPPRPLLLWIHGAAFSTWVVLLYRSVGSGARTESQACTASSAGLEAGLATVMVVLGLKIALVMTRFDTVVLQQKGVDAFLSIPFVDMITFGSCIALAIYWRKKAGIPSTACLHSELSSYGCCRRQIRFHLQPQPLLPGNRLPDRARHGA